MARDAQLREIEKSDGLVKEHTKRTKSLEKKVQDLESKHGKSKKSLAQSRRQSAQLSDSVLKDENRKLRLQLSILKTKLALSNSSRKIYLTKQ